LSAGAADADGIAHRSAVAEDKVQSALAGFDDDRSCGKSGKADDLMRLRAGRDHYDREPCAKARQPSNSISHAASPNRFDGRS
jgi:hypothetical protein